MSPIFEPKRRIRLWGWKLAALKKECKLKNAAFVMLALALTLNATASDQYICQPKKSTWLHGPLCRTYPGTALPRDQIAVLEVKQIFL
jgi:hypothetical protein